MSYRLLIDRVLGIDLVAIVLVKKIPLFEWMILAQSLDQISLRFKVVCFGTLVALVNYQFLLQSEGWKGDQIITRHMDIIDSSMNKTII